MSEASREIYAWTLNGERVFLGRCPMSDDEVQSFLNNTADIYANPEKPPVFNVRSAVFNARCFAGVQILPPSAT